MATIDIRHLFFVFILPGFGPSLPCLADESAPLRHYVPATVSPGWQTVFKAFPNPEENPAMPAADDIEAWQTLHQLIEKQKAIPAMEAAKKMGVTIQTKDLGGVPTLLFTPEKLQTEKKIILYTHGGAFTMLSAQTTAVAAALLASYSGLKVVSVDYTNPPKARWREIGDQIISVTGALQKEGYRMKDIAMIGDSAGGAIAAGVVLKRRDKNMAMPAALVLWSPWADITETGDTYRTLKAAEPRFLYERSLKPSADAYADPADQKNPYVSPVYGDFNKGFPPTLIQGGTREIFLSNFVRLYQAIDTAGQTVKLDLYEGMPHVFQGTLPDSPETRRALEKVVTFLKKYLHY